MPRVNSAMLDSVSPGNLVVAGFRSWMARGSASPERPFIAIPAPATAVAFKKSLLDVIPFYSPEQHGSARVIEQPKYDYGGQFYWIIRAAMSSVRDRGTVGDASAMHPEYELQTLDFDDRS